ncbi:ABC transporter I family member [Arachis hypogaea]|uniref:ABC transporter I family member n=1 Tax=Arachis hypogaea TaxID=3818 RepID=A0A6B9V7I4_ARAHY|nr:ABC transporter I family member [Arachis hypogaea]
MCFSLRSRLSRAGNPNQKEWRRDVVFAGYEVAIQKDVSAEKMIFGVAEIDPERKAELIKVE